MSFPPPRPKDKSAGAKKKDDGGRSLFPRETDPLIQASRSGGEIRARRSSKSPVNHSATALFTPKQRNNMEGSSNGDGDHHDGYESIEGSSSNSRLPLQQQKSLPDEESYLYPNSAGSSSSRPDITLRAQSDPIRGVSSVESVSAGSGSQPPLLEIPEEIFAVRKSALQVLKPLTKTWVVISVGFALSVLFGMARWTRLLPSLPFWFILFPAWASHVGLLWLHVLSARALSSFISEANDSRQRPDSRDHLNRTEYLPLLQRSLKFGLKTGLLSFCIFIFEILIYIRLARNSIPLSVSLFPLWLLVVGGILDGIICKTQHYLRVLCWVLTFTAMLLLVLKVDYNYDVIRWRLVFSPVISVLAIASASLVYIVYGHQIGYYRLTESQLTAGNLYSLAALVCIVLVVMIAEVIPLTRPVEIETRVFVMILGPLIVCLVGMGAWLVSRDEFARLLLYGGQSAVHPMKLRWESKGWTSVQGRGVTVIPMFGEVSFQPLERRPTERIMELCSCLSGGCYPYEEDQGEEASLLTGELQYHPYLNPSSARAGKSPFSRNV